MSWTEPEIPNGGVVTAESLRQNSRENNYEELLRKYIALVKFHERIDYIDRADSDGHDDGIDFSEDEIAELRRISALIPKR